MKRPLHATPSIPPDLTRVQQSPMTSPAKPSALDTKTAAVATYASKVDFGRVSADYETFRPGPPDTMYERIQSLLPTRSLKGLRAIDVGSGTGTGALALARFGATVTALDPAQNQLDAITRAATAASLPVAPLLAKAESVPLQSNSLDLYLALQCWHWFDRPKAAAEAFRLLNPGGMIVCASFDYLPHRSPIARATEDLILKHNPTWPMAGGHGVHINPMNDLPAAGFVDLQQFSFEHAQPFTHEGWRGRMRTCNGIGASLPPETVLAFDNDLAALLASDFPPDPATGLIHVEHRVWVVTLRKP